MCGTEIYEAAAPLYLPITIMATHLTAVYQFTLHNIQRVQQLFYSAVLKVCLLLTATLTFFRTVATGVQIATVYFELPVANIYTIPHSLFIGHICPSSPFSRYF